MAVATPQDVALRLGRDLDETDRPQVEALLSDAETLILTRIPDLHARIEHGRLAREVVVLVEATAATQQIQAQSGVRENIEGFLGALSVDGRSGLSPVGQDLLDSLFPSMDQAKAKAADLYAAMTPLQQAQTDLTRSQNDYALAVQQQGPASSAAAQAQQAVASATDRVEQEQAAAANATKSHTDRMVEQQTQAISALDKDLALRQALTGVTQAQQQAAAATAQHGAGSVEATTADQQLEQSMLRAAEAARQKALAQNQGADASTRDILANNAYNATLANLVAQAGGQAPAALRTYLGGLNAAALGAIGARVETNAFGQAVLVLPGERRVVTSAPSFVQVLGRGLW
jgi:hypothetical protein